MKTEVHIFRDANELASSLAEQFTNHVNDLLQTKPEVTVVLPGGRTPELFFRRLSGQNSVSLKKPDWEHIHLFWSDERCVAPVHDESNYGLAFRTLLRAIEIPGQNIHRIAGENDPAEESEHYSDEIRKNVSLHNHWPRFDWIILGLGEDGHTASIFPDQLNLLYSERDCEVAMHPVTHQKRITLTGKLLINAKRISFLVTGSAKKEIVADIIRGHQNAKKYPAYFIKPLAGNLDWYLDASVAQLIKV
jgi:6-phosphogluconolactonase